MPTLTQKDLAETLFEKIGISKRDSKRMVETFFEEIARALERREEVLLSNFGKFSVCDKKARPGRNLRNNTPVVIPDHRALVFHPSIKLKSAVNSQLRLKSESSATQEGIPHPD